MYHLLVLLQDQGLDLTTVLRTCVNGISELRVSGCDIVPHPAKRQGVTTALFFKPKRLLRVVIA